MDLPTYTNIWRIEKRLYKLYDLRLPMPLPIVWIGVFVGVLAPWSLLLMLLGTAFRAPWHVVYLVPPGVVTWLSTRPVIESKRLDRAPAVAGCATWVSRGPGAGWRRPPSPRMVSLTGTRLAGRAQAGQGAAQGTPAQASRRAGDRHRDQAGQSAPSR